MDTMERAPAAGWYDDGTGQVRWWDGDGWTEHVAPASVGPAEPVAAPSAPEQAPAALAAPEPLRPGGIDPVPSAAPQAETTRGSTAFQPETAAFLPGVAPTTVPTVTAEDAARYTSSSPSSAATFGSGSVGGTFAAPLPSSSLSSSGGGGPRTGVIVLAVLVVLALTGVGVWRYLSGPPKAQASAEVIASAVPTPTGTLPAGFTAHDETTGFKVMPSSSCTSGTSCRTVKLASRTTCRRLSALVIFGTASGNRVGSDIIAAKNVKAGKAVALDASVRPAGADTVRVSSVVCQPF